MTAVEAEAEAIGTLPRAHLVATGPGRTNAAAATTEAILRHGPFDAVLNCGLAGVLPGSNLSIGDPLVASSCIYAEEGLAVPGGVDDVTALGLSLGDFEGNAVPVSPRLLAALQPAFPAHPLATVATCSGTDAQASAVAERTGAAAEAMEGAAVVHAARRLGVEAIELRVISNTTGDRAAQSWDLDGALAALGDAVARACALL